MAGWSVSQPREIGTRGHCAPPPTGSPASPASRPPPALRARSLILDLALPGLATVPEHLGVGEAGTVVQWHRQGFRLYWRWRSRSGRPLVDREVRDLIRRMNRANPLWGASRIHGELLKLGIKVSQATVAKYMVRRIGTPSSTWRSFLGNEAIGIAAIDMFVAVSASFRLLYVMVIVAHGRRKIVRFDVTQHPTAASLSQQVIEAFPWDTAPSFLLRDRDASYGSVFSKRVEAMGVTENRHGTTLPVAERLRRARDRLDSSRMPGPRRDLQRTPFAPRPLILRGLLPPSPNASVTRQGLSAHSRPVQPHTIGRVVAIRQVGGLHHRYERLAA